MMYDNAEKRNDPQPRELHRLQYGAPMSRANNTHLAQRVGAGLFMGTAWAVTQGSCVEHVPGGLQGMQ